MIKIHRTHPLDSLMIPGAPQKSKFILPIPPWRFFATIAVKVCASHVRCCFNSYMAGRCSRTTASASCSIAPESRKSAMLDCLQPQPRQPVLRQNKLRIFRFRASAKAKDMQLASTRSSRAPCAFPDLRCCPRCWLFSCLGL